MLVDATSATHHRRSQTDGTITALTDEIATLRAAVATLAETVRSHDTQIRHLARDRKIFRSMRK